MKSNSSGATVQLLSSMSSDLEQSSQGEPSNLSLAPNPNFHFHGGNDLDNGVPVNGDTEFAVFKFDDRSEMWTDIDLVLDGRSVEKKAADQMPDPAAWIAEHIVIKMVKLRGARAQLGPEFADVPIVYELNGTAVDVAVRQQVEAAALSEGIAEVIWLLAAP